MSLAPDKRMTLTYLKSPFEMAHFIRAFELAIAAQSDAGAVPGLVHLSLGAELFEAALCSRLDGPRDQVTGSHRSHGLALAMGADPVAVAAEILGRGAGLSAGLGGTQHLAAPEVGFLTSNGIVGGQVPLAAGAALSARTLKTGGIAVAVFGDGAANQGAVLETMNLAVALKLPLLFVVQNNGLAQSTGAAYASGGAGLAGRARAFGLEAATVDGTDLDDMATGLDRLIAQVRAGRPAFLEAFVPRLGGHYHGDAQSYRCDDCPADPLTACRARLALPDSELDAIARAAADRADAAVRAALQSRDHSAEAMAIWAGRLGGTA